MQLTYQSPLYLSDVEKDEIDAAMDCVGKFYRTCFDNFWFNRGKTPLELRKKTFCGQAPFYIGTKMANSLIKEAQAKVYMWQEALCYAQQVKQIKLKRLENFAQKTENLLKLNQSQAALNYTDKEKLTKIVLRIKRLKSKLWSIHRKMEKIQAYLKKEKSITFGSKQSQRDLSLGKIDKKTWQRKRNNFIYGIGEGDVTCGNNIIKLLNESEIQIELLDLKKIVVKTKSRPLHQKLLAISKKTARVIRKVIKGKEKYYVQFAIDLKDKSQPQSTLPFELVIGTDLNKGFISVYAERKIKNQTETLLWQNYNYNDTGNSQQRKESLRKVVKMFIQDAKDKALQGKHNQQLNEAIIVRIENLNFKRTKAKTMKATTDKGKAYNAMLHNLPYKLFAELVRIESYKIGAKLELINPKNSSKKALELGLDRHLGAAKIIAQGN